MKTPVITEKQAREITGGRKPLVPVQYEEAVRALSACVTLDEAIVWSDKADALAAWGKIYRDDQVERQARLLKLHAAKRIGDLARELRPKKAPMGENLGAASLLVESGMKPYDAQNALGVSRLPPKRFNALLDLPRPPAPSGAWSASSRGFVPPSPKDSATALLVRLHAECRKQGARASARSIDRKDSVAMGKYARAVIDWLDEFERHLPKESK